MVIKFIAFDSDMSYVKITGKLKFKSEVKVDITVLFNSYLISLL